MKKIIINLALSAVMLFSLTSTAFADKVPNAVEPIIPHSQVDGITSFFNIKWSPGAIDEIGFNIYNETDEEVTYKVSLNKGITNANGIIIYDDNSQDKGVREPDITSLFNLPEEITIGPKSSHSFKDDIVFPNVSFNGTKVYGISFTQKKQTDPHKQFNQTVSYVLPLIVKGDKEGTPEPDLSFGKFEFKKVGGGIYSITTPFVNKNDNWFQKATSEVDVKDESGKSVLSYKQELDITPESKIPYSSKFKEELPAGDYKVHSKITTRKGLVFEDTQTVTLTKAQQKEIAETVNIGDKKKASLFENVYFDILIIIVAGGAGYMIGKLTKKKATPAPSKNKRKRKEK